jgi:hypothetical protein
MLSTTDIKWVSVIAAILVASLLCILLAGRLSDRLRKERFESCCTSVHRIQREFAPFMKSGRVMGGAVFASSPDTPGLGWI